MIQGVVIVGLAAILAAADGRQRRSAAERSGILLVESDPGGASVYVDGRLAGETPLTLRGIAAGVHRVRVVRLGYLENSRIVTIKADTSATVRVRLTNPASQAPNTAALRIVVLEGEGGVNIIQQKTAVVPVVEVRDRNDQPVAGAAVRFAVTKGRATFSGARTLSVTTDAAGRASVTGLTPTGAGPLQISATATFQGQTAAATIAQTNVMTAGQAGGAGGGGPSFTTLGIIGGAAVGGLLVAQKTILGGGADVYSAPVAGDVTSRFPGCVITTRLNTTLELHIKVNGDTVTGHAEFDGTGDDVVNTCPGGTLQHFANYGWGNRDPSVTGTTTNITFRHDVTPPEFPNVRNLYVFSGSLNGSVVTGTLTYEQVVNGVSAGVSTFPLTMNKK
jgi:outer membrane lipoprotein SlyB